jgi:hypothetical protein
MVTHKRKPFFFTFDGIELMQRHFSALCRGSRHCRRRVDVTPMWTQCALTEWRGQVGVSSSYSGSEVEISVPKAVTLNEVCTDILIILAQVRPRLLSNSLFTNPHDTSRGYLRRRCKNYRYRESVG